MRQFHRAFFSKNGESSRNFAPIRRPSAYTGFERGDLRLPRWTRTVPACVPPSRSHLRLPRSVPSYWSVSKSGRAPRKPVERFWSPCGRPNLPFDSLPAAAAVVREGVMSTTGWEGAEYEYQTLDRAAAQGDLSHAGFHAGPGDHERCPIAPADLRSEVIPNKNVALIKPSALLIAPFQNLFVATAFEHALPQVLIIDA